MPPDTALVGTGYAMSVSTENCAPGATESGAWAEYETLRCVGTELGSFGRTHVTATDPVTAPAGVAIGTSAAVSVAATIAAAAIFVRISCLLVTPSRRQSSLSRRR